MGRASTKPDWRVRAMAMMREMSAGKRVRGQYIRVEAVEAALRGPAARVPAREFWAWMAQRVEAGEVKVAKGKGRVGRKLGTAARVAESTAAATASQSAQGRGQAARAKARRLVVEWVEAEARVASSATPALTPGMIELMTDSLKRPQHGIPRPGIHAAIVLMAARGQVTVQHTMGGAGWARAAMDWATQQGWVTSEEGDAAMQDADQHVTTIDPDTVTLIELGSGW